MEHKGHNISDMGESRLVQVFQRRAQILKKKIDASREETGIFAEELAEIEDQLQVSEWSVVIPRCSFFLTPFFTYIYAYSI